MAELEPGLRSVWRFDRAEKKSFFFAKFAAAALQHHFASSRSRCNQRERERESEREKELFFKDSLA